MRMSLVEIAELVGGRVTGDDTLAITAVSPIDNIAAGSIVYADGQDKLKKVENSAAAAVLVSDKLSSEHISCVLVEDPLAAFILLLTHFYPAPVAKPGIHPSAVVAESAQIGENVSIGPYVVIGEHTVIGKGTVLKNHVSIGEKVVIGDDCTLHPQVTVYDHCHLGSGVSIHAGTVIGSDGFGYVQKNGEQVKMPHVGRVVIENDVEIGANTVVDRATLGETVIGTGTKIDNLVQVAHSVKLGKHNILCAFTGIAGSSTSGDHVIFAANVGVSDHVRIDDQVILGARAGVPPHKHLIGGNIYIGSPARPKDKAIEQELSVTRLPRMRKNMSQLKERVDALSQRIEQLEK